MTSGIVEESIMTWRDTLEIGLKEDAPFRKDNLPDFQIRGPEIPAGPGRSPEIPAARGDAGEPIGAPAAPVAQPVTRARRGRTKHKP